MPKTTEAKWCSHCGLPATRIERDNEEAIGRGELPIYIHAPRKNPSDPFPCARSNLHERDVVGNDWWNSADP
jgi:hypothetical protein